jgi:hypothetical protein
VPKVFLYGPDTSRGRVFDRVGRCEVDGAATLAGHALVFDKPNMKAQGEGLPNLQAGDDASVYGVLFDMSRKQLELLEGYFGGYAPTEVSVTPKGGTGKTAATTFIARRRDRKLGPSRANIDLSIRGAEENALPRDFVEVLRGLQPYDG